MGCITCGATICICAYIYSNSRENKVCCYKGEREKEEEEYNDCLENENKEGCAIFWLTISFKLDDILNFTKYIEFIFKMSKCKFLEQNINKIRLNIDIKWFVTQKLINKSMSLSKMIILS